MAHIVQRPTKIIPLTVIQYDSNGKKVTEIVGINGNFQNKYNAKTHVRKLTNLKLDAVKTKIKNPKKVKATILIYRKNQLQLANKDLKRLTKNSHKTHFKIHRK